MKKRIVLFTAFIGIAYLSLSSYREGPAGYAQYDCTGNGINGNVLTSCASGGGGHGSGTGPAVTITLDSAGIPVTKYKAGQMYTITIKGTGTNNSWFGFQACVLKGSGTAQTDAGTLTASASGTHIVSPTLPYVPATIVEHTAALQGTSVGNFSVTATWAAPATAGTGTIKIYATLNSVDHNGNQNSLDVSTNVSASFAEETGSTSVASISASIGIEAYPNPFSNQFRLQFSNADMGTYTLKAYDLSGKCVLNQNTEVNAGNFETAINTANWAPGFYAIQILKDGAQRVIPIIKQ